MLLALLLAAPPILSVHPAKDGGKDVEVGMKAGAEAACCLPPRDEGDALVVDLRSDETEAPAPDDQCDHPLGQKPQYCFERQGGLAHAHRSGVFTVHVPRGRVLRVLTWQDEVSLSARGKVSRRKSRRPPLPPPAMD